MSRYADIEELLEAIRSKLCVRSLDYLTQQEKAIVDEILRAPSIEIIHCRECKHRRGKLCGRRRYTHFISLDDFCSYGSRSEKPNNCEHITEDGVTCAKYPACDDCLDNPLNKVKGSERLVKGSEKPNNSTISKMEQVQ